MNNRWKWIGSIAAIVVVVLCVALALGSGVLRGPQGPAGKDGAPGKDGRNGTDASNVWSEETLKILMRDTMLEGFTVPVANALTAEVDADSVPIGRDGMYYVTMTVSKPGATTGQLLKVLIDTGASMPVIPNAAFAAAGISSTGQTTITAINSGTFVCNIGKANVQAFGKTRLVEVAGCDVKQSVLGVTWLNLFQVTFNGSSAELTEIGAPVSATKTVTVMVPYTTTVYYTDTTKYITNVITVSGTAPVAITATCTLPAEESAMPLWLANNFGGTENQWRRKIDQSTGLNLCAWEFLSQNRELGIGPNAVLRYSTGGSGTVSYGVRNNAANGWMAAYLTGPGDFTVAQITKSDPTTIDTATWVPDTANTDQVKARTPGSTSASAAAPSPATGVAINQAQLESLTGGPAQFWIFKSDHWEFNSGSKLYTLELKSDLPKGGYISYGVESVPGKGDWSEARITRVGEKAGPLNKASFVTP